MICSGNQMLAKVEKKIFCKTYRFRVCDAIHPERQKKEHHQQKIWSKGKTKKEHHQQKIGVKKCKN